MNKFKIYCDGACKRNGKVNAIGGWAYIILDKDDNIIMEYSGAEINTTNNIMEMKALIYGIEKLLDICGNAPLFSCEIYTDSAYIQSCYRDKWYDSWLRNNWKTASKTPVKNKDLWEKIIPFFNDVRFNFKKVKGHNGNYFNEMVDNMAQNAAKDYKIINNIKY